MYLNFIIFIALKKNTKPYYLRAMFKEVSVSLTRGFIIYFGRMNSSVGILTIAEQEQ